MKVSIHKFGGAALATPNAIKKAIKVIQQENDDKFIITVSAAYGITNIIREIIENFGLDNNSLAQAINGIKKIHAPFIQEFYDLNILQIKLLKKFQLIIQTGTQIGYLSDEQKDNILILGELFMAECFTRYLNSLNIASMVLKPEDFHLTTDGTIRNSNVDLEKSYDFLKKVLSSQKNICVVPGFYGITPEKKIITFGASGTDYTATVLAYIVDAYKIVIWKNVNGFMTADPRIVYAKPIKELTYHEAAELAHFGAKVLHPRAVIPAQLKKIPIEVRNVNNNTKTIISTNCNPVKGIIKSISYLKNILIIKVYVSIGGRQFGILSDLTGWFAENEVNVISVSTSSTCVAFLVDQKEFSNYNINELKKIKTNYIESIEIREDISIICVVGKGLGETDGIAARVFQAVAKKRINVELISFGASDVAYQFAVQEKFLVKCLKAVHKELFQS